MTYPPPPKTDDKTHLPRADAVPPPKNVLPPPAKTRVPGPVKAPKI